MEYGLSKVIKNKEQINISYCGKLLTLKFPNLEYNELSVGYISLTKIGKDIMNTINKDLFNTFTYNSYFSENYYDYVIRVFYQNNIIVYEPLENKNCLIK